MSAIKDFVGKNGTVQFLRDGNLLNLLDRQGKSKFVVKEDGSCSVGAGAEGMNFFTLNNTPTKPENKLLGVKDNQIVYFDNVDLTNVRAKDLDVKVGKFTSVSTEQLKGDLVSVKKIDAENINVENKLNVDEIEVENLDGKQADLLALKVVDINCLDTLLVENIDINGNINKSQKQVGSLDNIVSISKADGDVFDMENNNRLVIFGRHYNKLLAFTVKTNKKDLWLKHAIRVEVLDLTGEAIFVVEKMIKKVSENEFKVEIVFNKSIAAREKIEKIIIDLD